MKKYSYKGEVVYLTSEIAEKYNLNKQGVSNLVSQNDQFEVGVTHYSLNREEVIRFANQNNYKGKKNYRMNLVTEEGVRRIKKYFKVEEVEEMNNLQNAIYRLIESQKAEVVKENRELKEEIENLKAQNERLKVKLNRAEENVINNLIEKIRS